MTTEPYKISASRLLPPWFERVAFGTLDMHMRGECLAESPLTQMGRKLAWSRRWHSSLFGIRTPEELEIGLRAREAALVALYESIKANGYNGSLIAAWFDKRGQVHVYDGYHRVAVLRYLDMDPQVNVETVWSGNDYDFPLRRVLETLPRVGRWTYQPVGDERMRDWPVDRLDSLDRLNFIQDQVRGATVLDIGCSEGFFAQELARRGYRVTAIDTDPGKVAVTRYLSTINDLDVECLEGVGEDLARQHAPYDNILYLSVFHNTIWAGGTARAMNALRNLRGKAHRLFFEVPNGPLEPQWVEKSAGAPLHHFRGREFERMIEDAVGMTIVERYQNGYRPMYVLAATPPRPLGPTESPQPIRSTDMYGKPAVLKRIPLKRWLEESSWEKSWWGTVANTLGEQMLQEMYVRALKLDQYKVGQYGLDLRGKSVVDIGGGPVSILLRATNFSRAVVIDPCDFPHWVKDRYETAGIEFINERAETVDFDGECDEVWIYNVLQHVQDPVKLVKKAISVGRVVRVYEPLEIGLHPGHPHNLSRDALDSAFGRRGIVFDSGGAPGQVYYVGVFRYGDDR